MAKKTGVERAKEIATKHKIKKVYENSKGEFFTSENLADLSESGDKTKVTTHDFSGEKPEEQKPAAGGEVKEPEE